MMRDVRYGAPKTGLPESNVLTPPRYRTAFSVVWNETKQCWNRGWRLGTPSAAAGLVLKRDFRVHPWLKISFIEPNRPPRLNIAVSPAQPGIPDTRTE